MYPHLVLLILLKTDSENPCFPSRLFFFDVPCADWENLPSQLVTDSLPMGTVLVILDNE